MSVYEFTVSANVPGADKIEKLGADTFKLADYMDRVAAAQTAWLAKNDARIKQETTLAGADAVRKSFIEQLEEAQRKRFESEERGWRAIQAAQDAAIKQNEKYASDAEKNADRIRKAQEAAANAAQKANEQLGASVKNFIQNPLGAAGEAAEKFILQYGAVGVAGISVASGLAIVGGWLVSNASAAAKYGQDISNLASRTGMTTAETQLYSRASELAGINAGTLTTAMRTLSRGMSENSDEGKKQKQVLTELGIGADAAFKPMGQLLPEIFEKLSVVGSAMERDRMTIALFGRSGLEMEPLFARFQELQDRVTSTGVVMSKDGIDKLRAYQEEMTLLGMKWDAIKLKLAEPTIGFIEVTAMMYGINLYGGGDAPTHATGQEVLDQRREQRRGALHAGVAQANSDALDSYNASVGPKDPLKKLTADREPQENAVREAADTPARKAALEKLASTDAQIKAVKDGAEATKKLASEQEHLAEETKRAREALAKSREDGEPTAQRRYSDSMIGAFATNRSEMARAGGNAGSRRQVGANSQMDMAAALNNFVSDLSKQAEKLTQESQKAAERAAQQGDRLGEESASKLAKSGEAGLKTNVEFEKETPWLFAPTSIAPPSGYVSPAEQMRLARNSVTANLRHARGSSPDNINGIQKAGDEAEYQAQLRINALKLHGEELETANLDALATKKQKDFEADLAREDAIEALREKDLAKYSSLADSLFDAIHGRSTNRWMRSFATDQAKQVVSNVASVPLQSIGHILGDAGGMMPSLGPFGNILKGTVLDGANSGPVVTKNNTDATVANTAETKKLSDAMERQLQTIPGSASYNPAAQAAATSQYQAATGVSIGADGLPNLPGSSLQSIAAMSPGSSSSSIAALTGNSTAVMGAMTRVISGSTSPSDLAIFKAVASGVGGVSKLAGALGGLGGSSFGGSYGASAVIGPPVIPIVGIDPETGAPMSNGGPPSSSVYGQDTGLTAPSAGGMSLGQGIGGAAAVAGGTMAAIQGFSKGGTGGDLQGAAGVLAAMSVIPVIGPFAAAAGAFTGMLSSVLTMGPAQRAQQITDYMAKDQYLAPTAMNVTQGMNGTYEDFDARGNLRTSTMSAVPTVAEPYITTRTLNGQQSWYDAPGVVKSPYSGGPVGSGQAPIAGGTTIVVNGGIQAMDSDSFHQFLQKPGNSMAVGESLATHLQSHEGRASNEIRFVAGS